MEKKTSREWFALLSRPEGVVILDPDGWDKSNFDYSFNKELITENEYYKRLLTSSMVMPAIGVTVDTNGFDNAIK